MGEIINLSKRYYSVFGMPFIDKIDLSIFEHKYYADCMKCDFCNDLCCSYGGDIDIENIQRLKKHKNALEKILDIKFKDWFTDNYIIDKEFPGGKYKRTKVINNKCIFLNKNQRGCLIHTYCLNNNIDYHLLKPMVGILFPLTFDNGLLRPSNEILDNSLTCYGNGATIYDGSKSELLYYFGNEFIEEIENKRKDIFK